MSYRTERSANSTASRPIFRAASPHLQNRASVFTKPKPTPVSHALPDFRPQHKPEPIGAGISEVTDTYKQELVDRANSSGALKHGDVLRAPGTHKAAASRVTEDAVRQHMLKQLPPTQTPPDAPKATKDAPTPLKASGEPGSPGSTSGAEAPSSDSGDDRPGASAPSSDRGDDRPHTCPDHPDNEHMLRSDWARTR